MTLAPNYIGVDIAKGWIDVFDPETTRAAHILSTPKSLARQAREFARATGRLAKTDKVDAKVLAKMGAALRLSPTPPPEKTRAELAEMGRRRADIKAKMRAESNRLKRVRLGCMVRDIA